MRSVFSMGFRRQSRGELVKLMPDKFGRSIGMSLKTSGLKNISLQMRSDLHLTRKLWHISTGLIGLAAYYHFNLTTQFTANALLAVAFLGLTVDLARLRFDAFNELAIKVMKPFMRESEKHSISGLPFYALGVALSLHLFPEKLAILAILFLIFSDPISSLIGILYGREKILPNKSLQGCLAGFATCYVLTMAYGLHYSVASFDLIIFALFAGALGSVSEMVSGRVDDNLAIPVISGLGLTLLNEFVPLF